MKGAVDGDKWVKLAAELYCRLMAMASIGTGIGVVIWFGWPIVMQGAAVLLSLLPALEPAGV